MRLGFNARYLQAAHSGIERYIFEVVSALACHLEPEDDLVALVPSLHTGAVSVLDQFQALPSVKIVGTDWPVTRAEWRVLWDMFGVGLAARRHGLDLYWGPSFSLPLWGITPAVVTVFDVSFLSHAEAFTQNTRLFHQFFTRLSTKRANAVLTLSEHARQEIVNLLNVDEAKVHAIPLGVNPKFKQVPSASARQQVLSRWTLSTPYLLCVAKLSPRKNIPFLIRAFGQWVSQTKAPHTLVLVGERGWLCEEIDLAIAESPVPGRIRQLGRVSDDDLVIIYNAADLFVFPSLHEGFGLPILEALACGVPVIASDSSSLPEVIGTCGLLFDPKDPSSLVDALQTVTSNPGLRQQFIQSGLRRAQSYSWGITAQKTLQVFRSTLDKSRRSV